MRLGFAALIAIVSCAAVAGCVEQATATGEARHSLEKRVLIPRMAKVYVGPHDDGISALRARVAEALRAERIYSPAGQSAFEAYLAWHSAYPNDIAVTNALSELRPYVVIGVERSISRNDITEARRLVNLLEAADSHDIALVRLREQLRSASH